MVPDVVVVVDIMEVVVLAVGVFNIIVNGSTVVWKCNKDMMTIHEPQKMKKTAVNAITGCFLLIHFLVSSS